MCINTDMKHNTLPALLIFSLVIILGALLLSCATQKKEESQEMILQGMVKIYGSEPHTWVGIETVPEGKIYAVSPPEKAKELRSQQGYMMEFTVIPGDNAPPAGLPEMVTLLSWRRI